MSIENETYDHYDASFINLNLSQKMGRILFIHLCVPALASPSTVPLGSRTNPDLSNVPVAGRVV